MEKLHDELEELYFELGIARKEYCTEEGHKHFKQMVREEKPLPEDI